MCQIGECFIIAWHIQEQVIDFKNSERKSEKKQRLTIVAKDSPEFSPVWPDNPVTIFSGNLFSLSTCCREVCCLNFDPDATILFYIKFLSRSAGEINSATFYIGATIINSGLDFFITLEGGRFILDFYKQAQLSGGCSVKNIAIAGRLTRNSRAKLKRLDDGLIIQFDGDNQSGSR